jgi:tetratricopeptide (TPR) repeat protein
MCLDAASGLGSSDDPAAPFKSSAEADNAYRLLQCAKSYSPKAADFPDEARVTLATAAWYRDNPNLQVADELTRALEKKPGFETLGKRAFPLLLGKAKALAANKDRPGAVDTYLAIMKLHWKKELTKDYRGLYRLVLKPALDLFKAGSGAGHLPPEKHARLLADLGWLAAQHSKQVQIPLKDALADLNEAIKEDPRAEYYVKRAYCRYAIAGARYLEVLDDMEADCKKAIKLVENGTVKYFQAYGFYAFVMQLRANDPKLDRREKKKLLISALDEYQKAITLAKGQEDERTERPPIQFNRIVLALKLANLATDPKERKKYLDGAKTDAEGAVQRDTHPSIDRYYQKYGEVLEQRSWQLGENEYADAVDAYRRAIDKNPQTIYRISLIKGLVQLVKFGGGKKDDLADAIKAYNEALEANPNPLEKASLNHWVANAYWLLGNFAEAKTRFEEAIQLSKNAKDPKLQALYQPALTDLIEMFLAQAADILEANPGAQPGIDLLKKARELAEDVTNRGSKARLLGRSWELEEGRKAKEKAMKVYEDALKDSKDPALFARRLQLLARYTIFFKNLPSYEKLAALAKEAAELADDPNQFDPWVRASLIASAALGNYAKDKDKTKAIAGLEKAQKLTSSYHPDWKYWSAKLKELK